ncbi:DUF4174 domain-containing protein [Pelagicoccus mobilis]|uniref:DUF4174 domain-containing protein n=1 Tax=Pelagicoccus mobilis TaxID=415221 RepID=A0A934S0H4_9BACT|nr:DUF4174 domain-containing protein [Pelagicoccus mobilis]MBK1880061.1 DUF4174 domain-containing protein [Pelagicoccus mobilis]
MNALIALLAMALNLDHAELQQESTADGFASHRLIAYVLSDETQKTSIEEMARKWEWEISDRDILMVNLGDIEIDTEHSFKLSTEEKQLWRQLWQLDLEESRFILVGKDGGPKAFQRNELSWQLFFDLIDEMPLRKAEMEATYRAAQKARKDS